MTAVRRRTGYTDGFALGLDFRFFSNFFSKKKFNFFSDLLISQRTFLTLSTFNVKSNCTCGQTSRSATHPHTTQTPTRLTSPFLPDDLSRKKSYLSENSTISIILTLGLWCHTFLFLNSIQILKYTIMNK